MPDSTEDFAGLDKLVHEPARLVIMTMLSACRSADFVFLQRFTGMNKGTLSSHLSRLEEAGLVEIAKRFVGRKPNTAVRLTPAGRVAIERHWQRLDELRDEIREHANEPVRHLPANRQPPGTTGSTSA